MIFKIKYIALIYIYSVAEILVKNIFVIMCVLSRKSQKFYPSKVCSYAMIMYHMVECGESVSIWGKGRLGGREEEEDGRGEEGSGGGRREG